jgi:sugar lactone lactonase YvrE
LDLDGTVRTLVGGLDLPTSLAVGPDGTVAIVEAGSGRVLRWRSATGLQEVVRDLPYPDSVAVDGEGTIWITGVGPGQILAVAPDGRQRLLQIQGLQDPGPVAIAGPGLLLVDRADSSIWRTEPPVGGPTAARS